MTWKEFFGAIYNSKLVNLSSPKIVKSLFEKSGAHIEFEERTAKSWLDGKRQCNASRYFPDGRIEDVRAAYSFFRNRSEEQLKTLQKIFREQDVAGSAIDVVTDNLDTFCWSLVNGFLDLLGFQRVDIPITALNEDLSNQKVRRIFLNAVCHYRIMETINREPPVWNRSDEVNLELFLDIVDKELPSENLPTGLLSGFIESFIQILRLQTWALEAALNRHFDLENENASINMGDGFRGRDENETLIYLQGFLNGYKQCYLFLGYDDEVDDDNDNEVDDDDIDDEFDVDDANSNEGDVPELIRMLEIDDNPFPHIDFYLRSWEKFIRKMNRLYEDICAWNGETADI